jgi:hypothetical protein
MFRARERGMSFWPFAVSLLVLIVMVVLWFGANSELDQWKRTAAKAETDRKEMEEARNKAQRDYQTTTKSVGYQEGTYTTGPKVDAAIKEMAPKIKEALTATFDADKYTPGEDGKVEKTVGNKITVVYLLDTELADVTTLEGLISKFEVAASRMRRDIERSFNATAAALTDKEAVIKADQATIQAKDTRIAEISQEKAAIESRMREQENELKNTIQQKEAQLAKSVADAEAASKSAAENVTKLVAELSEQKGQVRSLVQRDAPALSEGPDGEVVLADNGVAIVNRGRTNFLMPGTIFDVLGRAKGGATYKKGSIKITNVDDATARGAVLEESARDPISRGDLVQSLTYSPNRQLHFALVGDFKKMGRSQVEALLKKLGASVDARVSSETNYLVVGATPAGAESMDDNPEVKSAKDLGIRMITEEQLASFTRY